MKEAICLLMYDIHIISSTLKFVNQNYLSSGTISIKHYIQSIIVFTMIMINILRYNYISIIDNAMSMAPSVVCFLAQNRTLGEV